jgi:hypothetical protein
MEALKSTPSFQFTWPDEKPYMPIPKDEIEVQPEQFYPNEARKTLFTGYTFFFLNADDVSTKYTYL